MLAYVQLAWPLGHSPAANVAPLMHDAEQHAQRRAALADRMSEAWRRRQQADKIEDALEARLAAEEADAELDALTGLPEDAP
jgi:hypothetical protein